MTDDLKQVGDPDRLRINIEDAWERREACAMYRSTEKELPPAVAMVGPMRGDIKWYLGIPPYARRHGRR